MVSGAFSSQFQFFHLRSNSVWFETLPAIKVTASKVSASLTGTYAITYPNPRGLAINLFTQFVNQELWFAHNPTSTMYRFMAGQVNSINPQKDTTVVINGRALNGLLTDQKVYNSWSSKRGDFVIADPTFGFIPLQYGNVLTTWNAFTDDYDRFDWWNTTRWGAQPAFCTMGDTDVLVAGDGGTNTVTGATAYTYKVIEFRAKVSAAANSVKFGFSSADRTKYAQFSLNAATVTCQNDDGGGAQSTATSASITQTNYNYYRIEWEGGTVRFLVNGTLEVTCVLNVPTTAMYPFFENAATTKTLSIDYVKVIQLLNIDDYLSKGTLASDLIGDICNAGSSTVDYTFWVDDDFDLHATPSGATASGYSYGYNSSIYTAQTQKVLSINLNEEAKDLYNYVRVQGGETLRPTAATDNFIGNAAQTSWALGYKAQKPLTTVTVGGAAKAEGTDFNVNYGTQNTIINFVTAPANTAAVVVTYNYYLPIIATVGDGGLSKGQPTREYDETDTTITTWQRAMSIANALLLFYSDPRTVITTTIPLDPRLQLGTTVNVDAPYYGINDSEYEIIQIQLDMAMGTWTTTLTLASTTINTSAEIIRTILQQLKQLQAQSDTNDFVLSTTALADNEGLNETLVSSIWRANDSFILGFSPNWVLGRGAILNDFEGGVADWTGTNATLSSDTGTFIVGAKSMKLVASASPFSAASTTSLGDLSSYMGANSGQPLTGTLGVWVYGAVGNEITSVTLRVGSSSGNYAEVVGVKTYTDAFDLQAGWNYFVFRMKNSTPTGTPNWTSVAFTKITFASGGTPTIYADYYTIGTGDIIAANGLGDRRKLYTTTTIVP